MVLYHHYTTFDIPMVTGKLKSRGKMIVATFVKESVISEMVYSHINLTLKKNVKLMPTEKQNSAAIQV